MNHTINTGDKSTGLHKNKQPETICISIVNSNGHEKGTPQPFSVVSSCFSSDESCLSSRASSSGLI
jgi:hypothetical protein